MSSAPSSDSTAALQSEDDDYHFGIKLCILGPSDSGKTAFVECMCTRRPVPVNDAYSALQTSSVQYSFVKRPAGSSVFGVQVWDCPGSTRLQSLTAELCKGATAAIVLFDAARPDSFESARITAETLVQQHQMLVVALIASKTDASGGQRAVPREHGQAVAQELGVIYGECSAVLNIGVNEIVDALLQGVLVQIPPVPEASLLVHKRVRIGKRLSNDPAYRHAMFNTPATGKVTPGGAAPVAATGDW